MVQQSNTSGINIANGFGVFGIKYLIVQGDTANRSLSPNNPLVPYSFNSIYSNLNASPQIKFVKSYGTSSVYADTNAMPLVYATNLYSLATSSSQRIMDAIMNSTLNISNYSIYSSNFSAPILWYGSTLIFRSNNTEIRTLQNFSKPATIFYKDSPSRITVHINNATTPYYLIFRETYDPRWAAFYSNGTEVNPRNHIAVNGFANAWYMNRTGSYTITLYYTPQTLAWIAWAVSFAALGATLYIGYAGLALKRKEKKQARQRIA